MILRPYQLAMVNECREAFRKHKAVILNLATGGGKTPTACHIIKLATQKGKRCIFIAHRNELLTQASNKLTAFDLPHGMIAAGRRADMRHPVQVASIQTLHRRKDRLKFNYDLAIIDETHLAIAPTYMEVIEMMPDAKILGITGTSARLDARGLGRAYGGIFDQIVCGPSIQRLVSDGFLVPTRVFSSPPPDMSPVHIINGEYNNREKTELLDKAFVTGDSVSQYLKHCEGRTFIEFNYSVKNAMESAQAFRDAGIPCVALSGKDSPEKRAAVIRDVEAGLIRGICNAALYIEGLDICRISCVIDSNPTASLTRFLQKAGRGMRIYEGKEDLILLDRVGSVMKFGMPDDDREWSLAGRVIKKRTEASEPSVRICGTCWSNTRVPAIKCGNCGLPFPIDYREVMKVEGELFEVKAKPPKPKDPVKIAARMAQGRADSIEALTKIGISRGMHPAKAARWGQYVWAGRQAKLARKSA